MSDEVRTVSTHVEQIVWHAHDQFHLLTTVNYHHSFDDQTAIYQNIVHGNFDLIFYTKPFEYEKAEEWRKNFNKQIPSPESIFDRVNFLNKL